MYLPRARLWRGDFYFCVSQGNFARCDERPKTLSLAHSRAAALARDCATVRLFFCLLFVTGALPPYPPPPFGKGGRKLYHVFISYHLPDTARTNRNIVIMVVIAAQACGRSDIIAQCL